MKDLDVEAFNSREADVFGDSKSVDGKNNNLQQIRLSVEREVGTPPVTPLTNKQIVSIRGDVRRGLVNCPYVESVVSIEIRTPTDDELIVETETTANLYEFNIT